MQQLAIMEEEFSCQRLIMGPPLTCTYTNLPHRLYLALILYQWPQVVMHLRSCKRINVFSRGMFNGRGLDDGLG